MYVRVTRGAQVTGVGVFSLHLTGYQPCFDFMFGLGILKFVGREDWLTIAAIVE